MRPETLDILIEHRDHLKDIIATIDHYRECSPYYENPHSYEDLLDTLRDTILVISIIIDGEVAKMIHKDK